MRLMNKEGFLGISIVVIAVMGVVYFQNRPTEESHGSSRSVVNKTHGQTVKSSVRHGAKKKAGALHSITAQTAKRGKEQNEGRTSKGTQKVGAVTKHQTHENDLSTNDDEDNLRDTEKALQDWGAQLESYCGESEVEKVVTEEEQVAFAEVFNKLDSNQQLEQIRQAMNLLPDKTVQVVYGILFDSTQSEEVVDVIFSDLLNRNEAIKNPVMEEIVKDKKHPMYFESARILDVIGLLPK